MDSTQKLSYYTIFTDEISETNNKKIVLSTRSSRSVVVSKKIYDALQNNKVNKLSKKVRKALTNDKILVDENENELDTIISENKQHIADDTTLYQVIQPSAMCQLGCDYCGQDHKKVNISFDLVEKLLNRLRAKLLLKPDFYKILYIGWFGGEPLMALNEIRVITDKLKELADEFSLRYGAKIVTNGLSLKPAILRELVTKYHITSFEITLDGSAEFHDQRRNTKEGHDTFDIIFKNLKDIFALPDYHELKCSITIRCNVDKRNYLGVSPLIKQLAENNFHKFLTYFYVMSVYSWGNDAHLKSFTKEEFADLEINWLIEQFEYGFKPRVIPGRVRSVCLAVSPENEMIDAYGNLFNCTEVSYVDTYKNSEYVLGNVQFDEPGAQYKRPLNNWNDEILNNTYQCHSCKMLPVCGGGCPKSWHEDMRACPSNKFNIKDKLLLGYAISKTDVKEVSE